MTTSSLGQNFKRMNVVETQTQQAFLRMQRLRDELRKTQNEIDELLKTHTWERMALNLGENGGHNKVRGVYWHNLQYGTSLRKSINVVEQYIKEQD